ncbi:MAG: ATPase [Deltaproteobacteria bacterium]|nr:ATPase [Deltaproteobacteria bacterium]
MIFGDAGSSWCKIFEVGRDELRIVPTRSIANKEMIFDWGTGHTARIRSSRFENDLVALTRGALELVDENDFTMLDLGSRDAKLVSFRGRRPVKLDWSVGCAAATGATVEMIGRFYEIDFNALIIDDAWTSVTCGTYAVERIMDAVSNGDPIEQAIARFIHGIARNAFNFTGKPERLYLSGGFALNSAFLEALGRYTEVVPMGRTVPLAGLWAFASEENSAMGPISDVLKNR